MKNGKKYSKYDFKDILRKRRKACGYRSCSKLAEKLLPSSDDYGAAQSLCDKYAKDIETMRKKIERWESGDSEPSVSEFKRLCDILDCDPEYLWGICPTPRKETRRVMDIVGLSQKTVEGLIWLKKRIDGIDYQKQNNPEYKDYVFREKTLEGLDILFAEYDFQDILPYIVDLKEMSKKIYDIERENVELEKEFDSKAHDLEYLTDDELFKLELEREGVWDEWRKLTKERELVEYHISQKFTLLLRSIIYLRGRM